MLSILNYNLKYLKQKRPADRSCGSRDLGGVWHRELDNSGLGPGHVTNRNVILEGSISRTIAPVEVNSKPDPTGSVLYQSSSRF